MEIIFLAVSESSLCGDGFLHCISSLSKSGVGFWRMGTILPSSLLSRTPGNDAEQGSSCSVDLLILFSRFANQQTGFQVLTN